MQCKIPFIFSSKCKLRDWVSECFYRLMSTSYTDIGSSQTPGSGNHPPSHGSQMGDSRKSSTAPSRRSFTPTTPPGENEFSEGTQKKFSLLRATRPKPLVLDRHSQTKDFDIEDDEDDHIYAARGRRP